MFIWDFVASTVLDSIIDWFYGQVMGFLGNFFAEMGNMGVELFQRNWVQSIVLFFSYLAWALYVTGLVVAGFECGIEYNSGRGNFKEMALNAIKGFLAVSLFTVVPVRLYELSVTLQSSLTAGITGYGTSIGDAAGEIINTLNGSGSLTEIAAKPVDAAAQVGASNVKNALQCAAGDRRLFAHAEGFQVLGNAIIQYHDFSFPGRFPKGAHKKRRGRFPLSENGPSKNWFYSVVCLLKQSCLTASPISSASSTSMQWSYSSIGSGKGMVATPYSGWSGLLSIA